MSTLKYWLWLTARMGINSAGTLRVLDHFITPERAYYADAEEYELVQGLGAQGRNALLNRSMEEPEKILADCDRLGIRIMTIQDADYPERLRQIDVPPPLLFVRGTWFHFDEEVAIGIVGARQATEYGVRLAHKIGLEIVKGGGLVVSGIAEGIDTAAVKGALSGGGPVVSLVAGGMDRPFPRENRYLYEDVAAAGALISEYPPGMPHKGVHFPLRNRIISGLCLGVAAIECKEHSGTMTTVRQALDQNRDVFALPGNVDAPMSRGTNLLIQQGGKLILGGQDILEEYRGLFPNKLEGLVPLSAEVATARREGAAHSAAQVSAQTEKTEPQAKKRSVPVREYISAKAQQSRFTDDQITILQAMGARACTVDELVDQCQIPARRVSSALTMLQVQEVVKEQGRGHFISTVELEPI